jgi:hypothetical protein
MFNVGKIGKLQTKQKPNVTSLKRHQISWWENSSNHPTDKDGLKREREGERERESVHGFTAPRFHVLSKDGAYRLQLTRSGISCDKY